MGTRGYRDGSQSRRPYDPARRVLACDACGAPVVVSAMASSTPCSACREVLEVPEAPNLACPRAASASESERREHLHTQLADEPMMPKAIARFATVLPDDLPKARRLWGRIRRRAADASLRAGGAGDPERAEELMSLTLALHLALPHEAEDDQLAIRGLIAAAAEALGEPTERQRALSLLASSAVRAGHLDDAAVWLAEMDPASRNLRAATVHATAAATMATAKGEWDIVLALLGATVEEAIVHRSSLALTGVLRANALEKSGDVPAAARELEKAMRERPSALATAKNIVARMPASWRACEKSLAIAGSAVRSDLVAHIPGGSRTRLGWLGVPGFISIVWGVDHMAWTLVGIGGGAILVALGALLSDARRRHRIALEAERVSGRIVAAHEIDDATVELELHIERPGGDVTVRTKQPWGESLRAMSLEGYVGCTFVGFWHPDYPTVVPSITIQRAPDGEGKEKREGKGRGKARAD